MDCSSSQPPESPGRAARPVFSKEQEAAIFLRGGPAGDGGRAARAGRIDPPACSATSADTPVYGAFVTLKRAGRLRSCCGHIESSVPLCEALDRAADRAATDDPRFPPIAPSELSQLDVDVWILWGPEPVAARGEDRVQAVVIGKHGLQIARGCARGLLLPGVAVDHGLDARTFLEQVCIKAGLPTDAWKDDDTKLLVFEGDAIHGRLAEMSDGAGRARRRPWPAASIPAIPAKCSACSTSCLRRPRRRRAAAVAGRDGAARRLDLLGPAGGGRVQPRGDSRLRDHPLPEAPAARARAGPWRRTGGGCFPAASWPPTPSWPRGWPTASTGWSSTRRPIARNTPSRCSCRCWPGWPRRFAWWGSRWAMPRCRSCCGSAWRCRWCCATCPSARCWSFPAT